MNHKAVLMSQYQAAQVLGCDPSDIPLKRINGMGSVMFVSRDVMALARKLARQRANSEPPEDRRA